MPTLPLAADYPFLDILWSMLVFMGFIMWIWLAISVFADIFRRHDMGGFTKAIWIIFVIFIPLAGVLVYLIAYSKGIAERSAKQVAEAQSTFDQHVREVAASSGPSAEIEKAQQLLASGAISQEEFERLKAKALGS